MLSNLFHIKILIAFINQFEHIIPLKDRELSFWPTQGIIGRCTFIGSIELNWEVSRSSVLRCRWLLLGHLVWIGFTGRELSVLQDWIYTKDKGIKDLLKLVKTYISICPGVIKLLLYLIIRLSLLRIVGFICLPGILGPHLGWHCRVERCCSDTTWSNLLGLWTLDSNITVRINEQ